MSKPEILAIDPKIIQEVLVHSFNHFHDNEFSDLVGKLIFVIEFKKLNSIFIILKLNF